MSDEELIDRLAQQAQIDDGDRALLWQTYRRIVASTIERMAEAGRLLPPVVETREEDLKYFERNGRARDWTDVHKTRTITTFADGSALVGPWHEVSP